MGEEEIGGSLKIIFDFFIHILRLFLSLSFMLWDDVKAGKVW